jgi:lysosomal acid lipase/cholesteryl ester hydrolase
LHTTKATSLSYIGFSQGTAQAFAALSIHPQLNEKVNLFIAIAPALSPKGILIIWAIFSDKPGLSNPIVDAFIKASPMVLFLLFGRKALLTSTIMWQSIICILRLLNFSNIRSTYFCTND